MEQEINRIKTELNKLSFEMNYGKTCAEWVKEQLQKDKAK